MMDRIVYTTKPDPKSLPGFWEPKVIPALEQTIKKIPLSNLSLDDAFILENVLTEQDCITLINFMHCSDNFEEVGVQGMTDKKDERIGSLRTSVWSPGIAENLWSKIGQFMPDVYPRTNPATDYWQNLADYQLKLKYDACAISPLLRFMKYSKGGQHYAHYDASYIYPDTNYRSLKSMVIYLTTNDGAATRFVKDGQNDIPMSQRNHDDWSRPVKPEEIIAKSECIQGNVLIFNHRLCHDVELYMGDEPRVIIRGDVIYKIDDLED